MSPQLTKYTGHYVVGTRIEASVHAYSPESALTALRNEAAAVAEACEADVLECELSPPVPWATAEAHEDPWSGERFVIVTRAAGSAFSYSLASAVVDRIPRHLLRTWKHNKDMTRIRAALFPGYNLPDGLLEQLCQPPAGTA